ncbi:MAG: hypothetical protein AAF568_12085, partial [Pseudomonadota bacterium]
ALIPRLADPLLLVTGLAHKLNYGLNRVRFPLAVPAGARVRLPQRVLTAERRGDRVQLVLECRFEIAGHEKPACLAESVVLFVPEQSPA